MKNNSFKEPTKLFENSSRTVYKTKDYDRFECPTCGEKKNIGWNWLQGRIDKKWIHECYNCGNCFETIGKHE